MGHSDLYLQKVESAARRSLDQIADSVGNMRSQVSRAKERTVGYVQDQPVRSALMALAVGTLVYAVVRVISSRSDR